MDDQRTEKRCQAQYSKFNAKKKRQSFRNISQKMSPEPIGGKYKDLLTYSKTNTVTQTTRGARSFTDNSLPSTRPRSQQKIERVNI
jgi:hypothetical protein